MSKVTILKFDGYHLLTMCHRNENKNFDIVESVCGAGGGVVVKALFYKPAGRGFDSRWCHWNFPVA